MRDVGQNGRPVTLALSTGCGLDMQMFVHGPDSDLEIRSLHNWLLGEGKVLRTAGIEVGELGSGPDLNEMGGVFEIVQFVIDSTAQLGALAVSIAAWREARGARCSVTFERNGVRVTLTGADLDDEETVRRALKGLGGGGG